MTSSLSCKAAPISSTANGLPPSQHWQPGRGASRQGKENELVMEGRTTRRNRTADSRHVSALARLGMGQLLASGQEHGGDGGGSGFHRHPVCVRGASRNGPRSGSVKVSGTDYR